MPETFGQRPDEGEEQDDEPTPSFTPKPQTQAPDLGQIDRVLVVMSGKGGVGKSTVALNLAVALKAQGLDIGVADMDITNPNTPRMAGLSDFRFSVREGLAPPEMAGIPIASTQFFAPAQDALAWRGPMKQKMILNLLRKVQWPVLDVLIVDLPPGTSDEPLSIAQLIPDKAQAVLVTTPQQVAKEDVERSGRFAAKVDMPVLGVVENMSFFETPDGDRYHIFGEGGGQAAAETIGTRLLGQVPIEPEVAQAGDTGKPVTLADPDSTVGQAFTQIARNVREAWEALEEEG